MAFLGAAATTSSTRLASDSKATDPGQDECLRKTLGLPTEVDQTLRGTDVHCCHEESGIRCGVPAGDEW